MSTTLDFCTSRSTIADLAVSDLAREFGTPLYVYDAAMIRQRIHDLQVFDVIRYAQKANSNLSILRLARAEGCLVDAVSAGEILRALAAGYQTELDPPPIVYTADIFDQDALDLVKKHRLHCNLGSPDMIGQLGAVLPGVEVTLRINPGFGHGHSQKTNTGGPQSKHGIWHEQLGECVTLCKRHGLTISGLHMHIGSGTDLQHLSQVCGAMEKAVRQVGNSIRTISAGGGLPINYRAEDESIRIADYHAIWQQSKTRLESELGHPLRLEIEPGRYLVAESGYLITEIRAVKKMGENLFYLVDAGFNNLARPIMYGAYHPMSIAYANHNACEELRMQSAVVGGPLCESGDIFTQSEGGFVCRRNLPEAQVGDFVVIERSGAYGFVMGSNYNSKPYAAEVLIDQGQAKLIRRRQTLESIFADEL